MKAGKPPRNIETERLILRTPQFEDGKVIFKKYASDKEVTKYLVWAPHRNSEETTSFINRCISNWQDETAFPYVITLKCNSEIIGMIELRVSPPKTELGYVSAREYWGNGYMTEALKAMVDISFANEEVYRVYAICDIENASSRRILEKVGMQLEGILKSYAVFPFFGSLPRDCCSYSITRSDRSE